MNASIGWPFLSQRYGDYFTMQHFDHQYVSAALAAGAEDNNTIRTNGRAITLMLGLSHFASTALVAAAGVIPQGGDFTLTVTVEDVNLQDGAIISLLTGNAVYPNAQATQFQVRQDVLFGYPTPVKQGGYIRFTIVNDNLANNIVRLVFHCVQMFPTKTPQEIAERFGQELPM